MKKLFSMLLALSMLLSLCAAAGAEEAATVTFWHTYGDQETPILDEILIPRFEAANPDIKVEAIRQSGDFNQMVVTALGTGVVPDIARVDITKTSAYAKLCYIPYGLNLLKQFSDTLPVYRRFFGNIYFDKSMFLK